MVLGAAVSNFSGEQVFYTNVNPNSTKNEQGSLGVVGWMKGGSRFTVQTTTLDDFVLSKGIDDIPFLKVCGAESRITVEYFN